MINFPKLNIATSVVNRILNAADEVEARAPALQGVPPMPNAAPLGEALEAEIAGPVPPVTETDPAMTADMVTGPLFP